MSASAAPGERSDTVSSAVRRAGLASLFQRDVRGPGPALVAHADDDAARRAEPVLERALERLDGDGAARMTELPRQSGGPQRLAQDLHRGECAVLARAAAGHDDRPPLLRGASDSGGETRGGSARVGKTRG